MTATPLQNVTHACFGLSYGVALLLELARLASPRPVWRAAAVGFGAAGVLAQTAFLLYHLPTPAAPYGSLLLLAWVLAVYYVLGAVRHARPGRAVFVLPVVIGLVVLALALVTTGDDGPTGWTPGERFWGAVHGVLILLASVGISLAFLASVMYLVQARRLRAKASPLGGLGLMSLERLEARNRQAVNLAFPLLTAGLLVGSFLLRHEHAAAGGWLSAKVLSTAGLWVVFLVLLYMRYAVHVRGTRLAGLSVVAFGLLLLALGTAHPFAGGVGQ